MFYDTSDHEHYRVQTLHYSASKEFHITLQTNMRDDLRRLRLTIQIFDQPCNTFYRRGLGRSMYMVRVCLNKAAFLFNCNQALETYRISYLLFFRTCVTLFRLRPELQPSDTIYGHIHRNSIFHTTFKD